MCSIFTMIIKQALYCCAVYQVWDIRATRDLDSMCATRLDWDRKPGHVHVNLCRRSRWSSSIYSLHTHRSVPKNAEPKTQRSGVEANRGRKGFHASSSGLTPALVCSVWLGVAAVARGADGFLTGQHGAGDAGAMCHELKPHAFLFPVSFPERVEFTRHQQRGIR